MPRLRSSLPGFVPPMTAKVVAALPEGPEWMYEVKLDGYRALLLKHDGRIRILSRNEKPLSYPEVEAAARLLKAKSVVLDGEIVALDRQGRPVLPGTSASHRPSAARGSVLRIRRTASQRRRPDEAAARRAARAPPDDCPGLSRAGLPGAARHSAAGDRRGAAARPRRGHREAERLAIRGRAAQRRVGQAEARQAAGICRRRLPAWDARGGRVARGVLRRTLPEVCRQGARRLHAACSPRRLPAAETASPGDMSFLRSSK